MDDILDPRQQSCDNQPPFFMVNWIEPPWTTLPTFLNFPLSHAFQYKGPRMIWDFNSSNMDEFNVYEREWIVGFLKSTIVIPRFWKKKTYKRILRQVMDLNYYTWIFNLVMVEKKHFAALHPPTPFLPMLHLWLEQPCWCKGGSFYNKLDYTSLPIVRLIMPRGIYVYSKESY